MVESTATFAHPTDLSGGHASHQGIGFHVFGHHGTCGNKGALAYRVTTDHRAVGAQGGTFADTGLGVDAMHWEMGARRSHIGEHTTRPTEHIVLDLNAFVDGDVVLHADVVADVDVVAHVHVLSERTVLADDGTFLDMAEVPDLGSLSDAHVIIDVTAFVYVVVIHIICIKIKSALRQAQGP